MPSGGGLYRDGFRQQTSSAYPPTCAVPVKAKLKEKIDEIENPRNEADRPDKKLSSSADTWKVKSMHRRKRYQSSYQEAKVPNAYSQ